MKRLVVVMFVGAVLAVLPQVAAGDAAPPGATARCKDGTYSFSQTHSGTCSHHGGVALWLDGSIPTTTTAPPAPPTTTAVVTTTTLPTTTARTTLPTLPTTPPAAPTLPGVGRIDISKTVLLTRVTRTSGCKLGANPDRRCSPGAYYAGLTRAVLCSPSFHTGDVRNVSEATKFAVEREYGLVAKHYGWTLEIDHIVSLELGGSNDVANLFPEKANAHPGYKVKDKLENRVADMVCSGEIGLRAAQRQIAANWQALYKQVYGATP